MDPNVELLKAVLALPKKIHEHMETFEVGMAVGEIMTVLKLVGSLFLFPFPLTMTLHIGCPFINLTWYLRQANKTLSDIALGPRYTARLDTYNSHRCAGNNPRSWRLPRALYADRFWEVEGRTRIG
jgi:hypothetical protein